MKTVNYLIIVLLHQLKCSRLESFRAIGVLCVLSSVYKQHWRERFLAACKSGVLCVCVCVCASGCLKLRTVTRHCSHWCLGNAVGNLWTLTMAVCVLDDVARCRAPSRLYGLACLLFHEILEGRKSSEFSIVFPYHAQGTGCDKVGFNLAFHSHKEFHPIQ